MLRRLPRHLSTTPSRLFLRASSTAASSTPNTPGVPLKDPSASASSAVETAAKPTTQDLIALQSQQAPNRRLTWAKSQMPRAEAMVGPRFEQTDLALQAADPSDIPKSSSMWINPKWCHVGIADYHL
ncbi:hypothetical protein AA313_de0204620 [Arthrobotrys entomopaga]|nr:hypothetical protein AA313_de0204620 [Arthrobotrys entomopaga]